LTVKVLRSNIRALKFYEWLGFKIIKETKERLYLEYSITLAKSRT
jgi:ribosomal protein S18 acetylase RimI-like enzyme